MAIKYSSLSFPRYCTKNRVNFHEPANSVFINTILCRSLRGVEECWSTPYDLETVFSWVGVAKAEILEGKVSEEDAIKNVLENFLDND